MFCVQSVNRCISDKEEYAHEHQLRIKAKHVLVADAIGEGVSVKLVSKYRGRGIILLLVHVLYRRPGEAEDKGVLERCLDIREHLPEGGTVRLVDDDDDSFREDFLKIGGADVSLLSGYVQKMIAELT